MAFYIYGPAQGRGYQKGAPFRATRLRTAMPFILRVVNGRLQYVKRPLSYLNHPFLERCGLGCADFIRLRMATCRTAHKDLDHPRRHKPCHATTEDAQKQVRPVDGPCPRPAQHHSRRGVD